MAKKVRPILTFLSEISGVVALFWMFSGFITTTSVLVSLSSPPKIFLLDFNGLSDYLKGLEFYIRFLVFLLSEVANAYFFGRIFNRLNRNYKDTITDLLLFTLVIFLTGFVSILFLKTIIFRGHASVFKIFVFFGFYFLSLLLTILFFFKENSRDTMQGNDSIEKMLGKVGVVVGNWSFISLIVTYFMFSLIVLFEYIWSRYNIP